MGPGHQVQLDAIANGEDCTETPATPAPDLWTLLLQWLVAVAKEWADDAGAWQQEELAQEERWKAEKITQEEAFQAELLALEQLQKLWEQNRILGQAVEAMNDDRWTVDTILYLEVSCMLSAIQPPPLALQVPWQPAATPQQAPGPGRKSSFTSCKQEHLARPPPQVCHHHPGIRPTAHPSSTWTWSQSCLEGHRDWASALLGLDSTSWSVGACPGGTPDAVTTR
ncbi:hypothetical protein Y1Q_0004646 [Alligator mississippiensis]|uniref:Uncharacterized protein n=1 Tax=Alligator mississippiensis TaxID=8496 RepID=A0A151MHR6_ALLMI|nr:hypothetical protein Y1Q_0004646 [Alligator mississippiensis]